MRAEQAAGAATYTGTWTTATQAGAYGGSVRHAASAGRRATYTFTGSSVAWISR